MTVQNVGDYAQYGASGLEEMDASDITVPRLQIVHKEGHFKDSLSGQIFEEAQVIILGLVKQRSLWHTSVDDDDKPMCRSTDFQFGVPNESDSQKAHKRFPWDKSGFNPQDWPAGEDGLKRLPCDGCQLKEWGSHPDGNKPYCSEQWAMPVLYNCTPEEPDASWVPAILTMQKSSLKALKAYLSAFQRSKQPAFTAVTTIRLQVVERGQTIYSLPSFVRGERTDASNYSDYATNLESMRNFLRNGRQAFEDQAEPKPQTNVAAETPREDPWASAPSGNAPQASDPWASPQQQAPAQPAPAQPAPQAPAPQAPAPQTVQGEVVQQPAPAQPAAQPAPQAPAAPAQPAALDDDLPF